MQVRTRLGCCLMLARKLSADPLGLLPCQRDLLLEGVRTELASGTSTYFGGIFSSIGTFQSKGSGLQLGAHRLVPLLQGHQFVCGQWAANAPCLRALSSRSLCHWSRSLCFSFSSAATRASRSDIRALLVSSRTQRANGSRRTESRHVTLTRQWPQRPTTGVTPHGELARGKTVQSYYLLSTCLLKYTSLLPIMLSLCTLGLMLRDSSRARCLH